MQYETFTVTATDKMALFAQSWEPADGARGLVCLVHGFGEHGGRYAHVAERLTAEGLVLASFDLRGHGRSPGARGYTPSYTQSMDDIDHFLAVAQARFPNLPMVLYGHSMGGNMVLNFALRRQPKRLRGVLCTSPWLRLSEPPPGVVQTLVRGISAVWRTFAITNEFEDGVLSHDPQVGVAYRADPLVHGRISAKLFLGVNDAGAWAIQQAHKFPLPLLLAHGDADKVTAFEASAAFAENAPDADFAFKRWPGMYHETHNEAEKDEVIGFYTTWILDHLA